MKIYLSADSSYLDNDSPFGYSRNNDYRKNPGMIEWTGTSKNMYKSIVDGTAFDWTKIKFVEEKKIEYKTNPNGGVIVLGLKNSDSSDDSDSESDIEQTIHESKIEEKSQSVNNIDAECFWRIINNLGWADKDERVLNRTNIHLKISRYGIDVLKNNISGYIERLRIIFAPFDVLNGMNNNEKNDFMAHIIGKGKEFYEMVLIMPEIIFYLLENKIYQPLFTYLTTI